MSTTKKEKSLINLNQEKEMARYRGPQSRISRRFGEPIFGPDKVLERKNYPAGQHGNNKRRGKQSEYGVQLQEKQKAKFTYGILEKQFSNLFKEAVRRKGITGEILLQLCERFKAMCAPRKYRE